MIVNFIQDVATPHNNVLLQELKNDEDLSINIWYCHNKHSQYSWDADLTNEIQKAKMYQSNRVDISFIKYCLTNKDEKYFIVGWMNPSTKLLIILFWILRRPFNIWFDYPQDNAKRSKIKTVLRNIFFVILKTSNAKIFGVGKMTLEYFKNRGFNKNILVNLPIFVDISKTKEDYKLQKEFFFNKYNIKNSDLFLTAGSRLIYEKGFDILIEAINSLDNDIKNNIKCVIVGKGKEKEKLVSMIAKYGLTSNIFIEDWLEIDEFKALIANSDIFIHPARFDAYGGTIFAMALGTPVIGSNFAGAALDRIKHSKNGLLYNGKTNQLTKQIIFIYNKQDKLLDYSKESILTANKWKPSVGVDIIKENIR